MVLACYFRNEIMDINNNCENIRSLIGFVFTGCLLDFKWHLRALSKGPKIQKNNYLCAPNLHIRGKLGGYDEKQKAKTISFYCV